MVDENLHDLHVPFPGSQVNGEVALVVRHIGRRLVLKQFENDVPEEKVNKRKENNRKENMLNADFY